MTDKSFIPYLHDPGTGAVRVPAHVEARLAKILRRPVHIRNTRDLAETFTDVLRASIKLKLANMLDKS